MKIPRFTPRAEWIWRRRGLSNLPFFPDNTLAAKESNRYVYFRKKIAISGDITDARVFASADGRYQLFVNGTFVGRGPARCNPEWQAVDPFDLKRFLRTGENVIAALVHAYGRDTSWYELPQWEQRRAFGCGGFFLQGDIKSDTGVIAVDTNAAWRYQLAEAWQRDVPAGSLGFVEYFDARKEPRRWQQVDFDDTAWPAAEVLRVRGRNSNADVVPFPMMVLRDIPHLLEEMRYPTKVLTCGEVRDATHLSDVAEQFEQEKIRPLKNCSVTNLNALLSSDETARVSTTHAHRVTVVLDFGEIVSGRVRFDIESPAGGIIDFAYGDRLLADGRVKILEGIPGLDVKYAHRYTAREGRQTWEQFEWSGFRYLHMTIRQCSKPMLIHSVAVNFTAYPVEHRGRFTCSDPVLDKLWAAGAKTVSLAMHDAYHDCPTREQRQWVGDGYVQMLVNFAAFGDALLAARFLRQIAQSQRPNGLTMMVAPGDFSVAGFTNIPDFCLYWIMSIDSYYRFTGDASVLADTFPAIVKAIRWFEQFLNPEYLLTEVAHWVFIDWAQLDKSGQVCALNAQFVAALRAAERTARALDKSSESEQYRSLAEHVSAAINEHFWDDARGVYVDARRKGVRSRRVSQQTNAAVIAFDIAPKDRWQKIFDTILDESRLVLTRAWDLEKEEIPFDDETDVVMAQPFYAHHLHRAMSKAGMQGELIRHVRKWACMLENDNKTFWETWQLHEISSQCHGWSATPTFDLSTEVLGVLPTSSGFRTFRVAPYIGDLQRVDGTFPTPAGDINITWRRKAETVDITIQVPDQTACEFHPPVLTGKEMTALICDGKHVPPANLMLENGSHELTVRYE